MFSRKTSTVLLVGAGCGVVSLADAAPAPAAITPALAAVATSPAMTSRRPRMGRPLDRAVFGLVWRFMMNLLWFQCSC